MKGLGLVDLVVVDGCRDWYRAQGETEQKPSRGPMD